MNVTANTKAMARAVLDYIEAHPERQKQSHYFLVNGNVTAPAKANESMCGTSMCVAGTALFLSLPFEEFQQKGSHYADVEWFDEGASLLGLSRLEANLLFVGTLEAEDPEQAAKEMLRAVAEGDSDQFTSVARQHGLEVA